ncbi:MAG: response regulator [Candidatus Electryonea clarkiae]|nr:response regulator [Candidatus Electryonea clarkiae]MDP8286258.1 response regulator [Candidatus Electryonea clarkiae]
MDDKKVLWADDEIAMLQPHIIFLGERGFAVEGVTSGEDAVRMVAREQFDAVLLDEQMAGLDGIATLSRIKKIRPELPVIMITKSEEESLMDEAIGGRINDYLTKPVNPSQILSALKKLLYGKDISTQRISRDYIAEVNQINYELNEHLDWDEWIDLQERLTKWAIEIKEIHDPGLEELLQEQQNSANSLFSKYIENNYHKWVNGERNQRPAMSHDIVNEWVRPRILRGEPVLFIVLDCLRMDHWMAVQPILRDEFDIETEHYISVLPTATPYSRNSIFSGLWPHEYPVKHPDLWKKLKADDSASYNRFERQLLDRQLQSLNAFPSPEPKYAKILDPDEAQRVLRKVSDYFDIPLVSMVFNFVDIVAHHRSTEEVIQTLIPDEAAYRSIVRSWFEHSPLIELLRQFGKRGVTIILTSDHGSIRVRKPTRVMGDREASTNLRYKLGRNLRVEEKHAIRIKNPVGWGIPTSGLNTDVLLARDDYYFVYPNEFNKYADKYRDSFLHGGVSLEEVVLPVAIIRSRK